MYPICEYLNSHAQELPLATPIDSQYPRKTATHQDAILPASVRSHLVQATRKSFLHNLTKQAVKAALPLENGVYSVKILLYLILQKNTRGEHAVNNKFLLLGMVVAFLLSFTDIGITATVDSSELRTAVKLENVAFLRHGEQTGIADQ